MPTDEERKKSKGKRPEAKAQKPDDVEAKLRDLEAYVAQNNPEVRHSRRSVTKKTVEDHLKELDDLVNNDASAANDAVKRSSQKRSVRATKDLDEYLTDLKSSPAENRAAITHSMDEKAREDLDNLLHELEAEVSQRKMIIGRSLSSQKRSLPLTPVQSEEAIKIIETRFKQEILPQIHSSYRAAIEAQIHYLHDIRAGQFKSANLAVNQKRWLERMAGLMSHLQNQAHSIAAVSSPQEQQKLKQGLNEIHNTLQDLSRSYLKNIKEPGVASPQETLQLTIGSLLNMQLQLADLQKHHQAKSHSQPAAIKEAKGAYKKVKGKLFKTITGKEYTTKDKIMATLLADLKQINLHQPDEKIITQMAAAIDKAKTHYQQNRKQLFGKDDKILANLLQQMENNVLALKTQVSFHKQQKPS